MKKLGTPVEIL